MATASTPLDLRVLRDAASQTRSLPDWSVQSILLSWVHFASEADKGEMWLTLGAWGLVDMLKVRVGRLESWKGRREVRGSEDGCGRRRM